MRGRTLVSSGPLDGPFGPRAAAAAVFLLGLSSLLARADASVDCGSFARAKLCKKAGSCYWSKRQCHDMPTTCAGAANGGQCKKIGGCMWYRGQCKELPSTCSEAVNQKSCKGMDDCEWTRPQGSKRKTCLSKASTVPSPSPNPVLPSTCSEAVNKKSCKRLDDCEWTKPQGSKRKKCLSKTPTVPSPSPSPAPSPSPIPVTPSPSPIPVTPSPSPIPVTPSPSPIPVTPSPSPIPVTPSPSPNPVTPSPSPEPVPTPAPTTPPPPTTPSPTAAPPTPAPTTPAPSTLAPTPAPSPPPGNGQTETIIVYPSADAEIKQEQPSGNFGTKKSMGVNGGGSEKISLVSFDVNLPEGSLVQSAKLVLFAMGATADLRVGTAFGEAIDERSITWDTFDRRLKGGVGFDAEAMLRGRRVEGERNVFIAPFRPNFQPKKLQDSWLIVISDPQANDMKQNFHTRQSKNDSFRPRLEITYSAKPPGPVVSTVGGAPSVVDELGGEVDLSVTLSRSPTSPVTVPITVSNTQELRLLSASSLQFDSSNWNVPQTVRVRGVDDGVTDGPQNEALVFLPMTSADPTFDGVEPPRHPITNHVIKIATSSAQRTADSGAAFSMTVEAVSSEAGKLNFYISPLITAGLHVNKRTGVVTWQPDRHQAGSYRVPVEVTLWNKDMAPRLLDLDLLVFDRQANPAGLYVWPEGGNDRRGSGTSSSPWASVAHAAAMALPGQTVYIRGGRHHISENNPDKMPTTIMAQGTPENHVVITRLPGERVAITCVNNGIYIPPGSQGITIRGLEMDGETDVNDHWEILATSWWVGPNWEKNIHGCRKGIQVDGAHVVVEDNVVHDFRQKGVNIFEGRYVTVRNNVVYNIGHHSISGGHGIMRQWERNFGDDDPDDPRYYRWDIYGNLVFAVEQRIYSNRLRHRDWIYLRLDEGKSILWDKTDDNYMKARCAHNLILYNGLEGIRMKGNPNVTVTNNAVMPVKDRVRLIPDGITADNDDPIPNLILKDNLVHSYFYSDTNKGHAFGTWDNFNDKDFPERIEKNYCSGGGVVYKGPVKGITDLGKKASVFRNFEAKDFRANPSLPAGVGVAPDLLNRMFALANEYGVTVEESGWRHAHIRSIETILANAPGSQVNLTHGYWIAPSKAKRKLKVDAYWFKVMPGSDLEERCKCNEVELIPDEEYWLDYAARRNS